MSGVVKNAIFGFLLIVPASLLASPAPEPQWIYPALDVREWNLTFTDHDTGMPRVGTTVVEKFVGGLKCRKTAAVVLDPEYSYSCHIQLALSNGYAMALYTLMHTAEEKVTYVEVVTGVPRIGVYIWEKSKGSLLCQKIAAVVPNPVPTYSCYQNVEDIDHEPAPPGLSGTRPGHGS